MEEVFAGFIVGAAISVIAAPVGGVLLIRSNQEGTFARRVAPPGTNIVALTMVVHFGAFLLLSALGIVLGLALGGIEDRRPDGGLGSPNLVYTLLVVALTAVIATPTFALPGVRRYSLPAALVFAALFGWAVPWLAIAAG